MNRPLSITLEHELLKIIARLGEVSSRPQKNLSHPSVLCYHSIAEGTSDNAIHPKEFERQIRYLVTNFRIVSLSDLLRKNGVNGMAVAITFDDGYADVVSLALPILKRFSVRATAFVLGSPSKVNRSTLGSEQKLLSINQQRALIKAGWEIGFHSATHRDLTKLTTARLEEEVIDGKNELEEKLKHSIRLFAYPFGRYNSSVIDAVKKAGYLAAFTSGGGVHLPGDDPYRLDRVVVSRHHRVSDLKLLLTDEGRAVHRLMERLIRIKDGSWQSGDHSRLRKGL